MTKAYLMVALAASMWGTWSLFLRPAESYGPIAPATEAMVVQLVILVVVGPFAWRERKPGPRPGAAWLLLCFMGTANALNMLLFFWAMQETSVAIAVLTHYLAPVLVALAAPLLFDERARRSTWVALGLALTGLCLLLEPWSSPSGRALVGAALGAGSAVFYAGCVLSTKRLQEWLSPLEVLAWHTIPSVVVLALFVPPGGYAVPVASLGMLVFGGLLPGALGGVLFVRGIGRVAASRAAVLTLLEPVVAVGCGVLAFAERALGALGALGALLVLVAAHHALRGERAAPEPA